jgi:hypothetical protein
VSAAFIAYSVNKVLRLTQLNGKSIKN